MCWPLKHIGLAVQKYIPAFKPPKICSVINGGTSTTTKRTVSSLEIKNICGSRDCWFVSKVTDKAYQKFIVRSFQGFSWRFTEYKKTWNLQFQRKQQMFLTELALKTPFHYKLLSLLEENGYGKLMMKSKNGQYQAKMKIHNYISLGRIATLALLQE